jgi:hypothetical protein
MKLLLLKLTLATSFFHVPQRAVDFNEFPLFATRKAICDQLLVLRTEPFALDDLALLLLMFL